MRQRKNCLFKMQLQEAYCFMAYKDYTREELIKKFGKSKKHLLGSRANG